jgi:glutathione S-transferase
MTQLFISPGACSFGTHVVVRELNLPVEVVKVPLRTAESPIHQINPLGRVPALRLADGQVITENSAILPYLADLAPGTPLFAPAGSAERAQIQSWIGYLSSELHVGTFRPINRPERYHSDRETHPVIKQQALLQLENSLAHIEQQLAGKTHLVGERFTIADAYLGVFLSWVQRVEGLLAKFPALAKAYQQFQARPSVQASLAFEQV